MSVVAAITLVLLSTHIALNGGYLMKARNKIMLSCLFLLCVAIPMILTPYHLFRNYLQPGEMIRVFANNVIYLEIAISSMILASKYTYSFLRGWFTVVFGIVLIGFAINYIDPGLFYALKLAVWGVEKNLEGIEYGDVERVGGFYLKSTYASASLVMLAPVGVFLFSRKSFVGAAVVYLAFVFLVFVTGARSGLMIIAVCSVVFLVSFFRFFGKRFRSRIQNTLRTGLAFLPVCLVLVGVFLLGALSTLPESQREALLVRVSTLFSADKLTNDESLKQRSGAQLLYLEKIKDNAFFGYGATYRVQLRRKGYFWLTSHNTYVEMTFFYGLTYLIILLSLMFLMMSGKWEYWVGGVSGLNYMQMLGLGLLLYCLFANTLMQNRSLFFSLGFLLGIANKNILSVK